MSITASLPRQTPYLRLHCVNVYVRDQNRSLKFYLEQLGFQLAYDTRLQSGNRWVAVSPPDGSALLSLVVPRRESEQEKLIGRATQVVFLTEDFPAQFMEWSNRGVKFLNVPRLKRIKYDGKPTKTQEFSAPGSGLLGGESNVWGGMYARFKDVDGNSFSLVSFDEVTHAVEAQRLAHAKKLEAERRSAQELEIAKQVQARLFPQSLPEAQNLDYAGMCMQARQVGGDFYDFLDLGEGRLGLVIGDISGKGIAAALLMANLQANLRSQCAILRDRPNQLLQSVNRLFCQNTTDGAFATLFFAEYDAQANRLRYANCGHLCALLLRKNGSMERLKATATILGAFSEWDCGLEEQRFFPGDMLTLYTDGVTESFNEAGDEFGEERLIEVLTQHRKKPSNDILNSVVGAVRQHSAGEQHDDITLIVAKCIET